ncbi:MAG: TIGR03545 family protein [Planctomycetaceae bacterium]
MLRWSYLVPRVLIATIIWAFFAFGFDPLLRYELVSTGESIIGAKVDVASLATRFSPPELRLSHVEVADPRRTNDNLFDFGELRVRLAGDPLLHREYVIKEATLDGLRVNADRLSDGSLDPTEDSAGEGMDLGPLRRQLELVGLRWYDDLVAVAKKELDPGSLETVQVTNAIEEEWRTRIDDLKLRIDELQERIDGMQDVTRVKGKPLEQLDAYARASDDLKQLLIDSNQLKDEIQQLPALARRDVARIDQARRNDTERLRRRISQLPLNGEEIAKSLLGPQMHERLQTLANWMGWTRRYIEAGKEVEPALPVSRGQWIEFPRQGRYPKFVLQSLRLTGEARHDGQPFAITGQVNDVSSDPQLFGRPTTWQFVIAGPDPFSINGHSDLTLSQPVHEITFDWRTDRPTLATIGRDGKLAVRMTAPTMTCGGWVRLDGDQLSCQLKLRQPTLSATLTESSEDFAQQWIAPALTSIHETDATLFVTGTLIDPQWKIESDLGRQVASGFQQVLVSRIDTTRARLIARAESIAQEKMAVLPGFANQHTQFLLAEVTSRESRAKQVTTKLTGGQLGEKLNLDRLLRR